MRPRILLLLNQCPCPPRTGAHQRDLLLCAALGKVGEVRTMVFAAHHPDAEAMEQMHRHIGLIALGERPPAPGGRWGSLTCRLPWKCHGLVPEPAMIDAAQRARTEGKFDVVVIRPFDLATRLVGLDPKGGLVDVDDLALDRCESRLAHDRSLSPAKRMVLRYDRQLHRRVQRRTFAHFHGGWIANPHHEAYTTGQVYGYLPNIPFCLGERGAPKPLPPEPDSKMLLFVGSLGYPMNRDGLIHFIDRVWPAVHEQVPEARLRVVGQPMPGDPQHWADAPGVEAVGFAEDLLAEYRRCAFTIAPIYGGSGTNIKVLESLAYQRAVVATPFALRGYEKTLLDGQSVRVGRDDASLADACVALLEQPAHRQALAEQGATVVAEHFNFETFCRSVAAQVVRVVG